MSKILKITVFAIGFTLIVCGAGNSNFRAFANGPQIGPNGPPPAQEPGDSDVGPDANSPSEPGPVAERALTPVRPLLPVPACAPRIRTEMRTVLVPQVVTETRKFATTVLRTQEREREVTVFKHVPETVERTRTFTVLEPQVRSHQETFTVLKPVTKHVEETYTVEVPYTEMRTGTRTVCKPVCKEIERKYPVCVPYCEKKIGTRTVLRSVPVTRTRFVTVDLGHWELHPACATCKPCKPCAPPVVTVCKTARLGAQTRTEGGDVHGSGAQTRERTLRV